MNDRSDARPPEPTEPTRSSLDEVLAEGAAGVAVDDVDGVRALLRRVLVESVVPRLVDQHGHALHPPRTVQASDVDALTRLAIADDWTGCLDCVHALQDAGIGIDRLCLDLLGPAARRLGDLWNRDECDFVQVTNGLWRIEMLLLDLGSDAPVEAGTRGVAPHRVMLVKARGQDHSLGLRMVSEFFRRSGWTVWFEPGASHDTLIETVHDTPFDVIGLSLGSVDHAAALADLVGELRAASMNARVKVMVGGPTLGAHPELMARIGADFAATDARQAVDSAERLFDRSDRPEGPEPGA